MGRTMRVIAIDPGLSGAIAVVSGKASALHVEAVYDLPSLAEKTSTGKTRRRIDPVALHELIQSLGKADRVICERMIAPPGVSGMAAFSMGATMATISTVLALSGLPLKLVSSNIWKRALDAPADKEAARQFAIRLYGTDAHWQRKKDHNRAESALIGAYGVLAG